MIKPAHISAILRKAVHCGVADKIGAHLEVVFSDDPSESVSERSQILVQRPIGIPIAVCECRIPVTETHGRMAKRLQVPRLPTTAP